ncbi:MAG: rRNA maturation RNase YbeY [Clostridia bacterium]|nr:rRNA maturation RNase YbeY [Clostridia bacterium]
MTVEGKLFPYKKKIERLFECAQEVFKEDFSNVTISLGFVSGDEIKRLNAEFRQIDRVTDVLSFPNLQKTPDQKLSEFTPEIEGENLFLGDVIICKKVAKKQAKEYGHSVNREICFLALHGLLHLLGYDHIEKDDEKLMMKTAEEILSSFGVAR